MKPNTTPDSQPTGSLEDLFRHHLAEAAVPPRPLLWDRIDNSLLVTQNATYRRRLAATRWLAAASLLLATLAGTGWWLQREAGGLAAGELAGQAAPPANRSAQPAGTTATALSNQAAAGTAATGTADAAPAPAATFATEEMLARRTTQGQPTVGVAAGAIAYRAATGTAAGQHHPMAALKPALTANSRQQWQPGQANQNDITQRVALAKSGTATAARSATSVAAAASVAASVAAITTGLMATPPAATSATAASAVPTATTGPVAATGVAATSAGQRAAIALPGETLAATVATGPLGELALAARPVPLQRPGLAHLRPPTLAALPVTVVKPAIHRWQFEASYAASAFNPNVDFSRAGLTDYDYNPALGKDSPALTEAAAAEYRTNLRAGLGQRLALRATRRLGGHWAISTGLEMANNTATSRTSSTFVGEQVPDFIPVPVPPLFHATNFTYQSAGLPLELRYDNPARRGWSAYGRLGAVVSALLRVRADVPDVPEANRTYTLRTANGDYRKVLANVRGGAGLRYQPAAGHFAFTLGPTAEVGLLSLNAHPAQDFGQQQRSFGFGLEMGVEFGK